MKRTLRQHPRPNNGWSHCKIRWNQKRNRIKSSNQEKSIFERFEKAYCIGWLQCEEHCIPSPCIFWTLLFYLHQAWLVSPLTLFKKLYWNNFKFCHPDLIFSLQVLKNFIQFRFKACIENFYYSILNNSLNKSPQWLIVTCNTLQVSNNFISFYTA